MSAQRLNTPASTPPLVAFASGKGGTGKSTLALALAADLADRHGLAVAALDLDPQAGLTDYAGLEPTTDPLTAPPAIAHGVTIYRGGRPLVSATDAQVRALVDRATGSGAALVVADLSPAWGDVPHRVLLSRSDVVLVLAVRLDAGGLRAARELTAVAEQRGISYRIVPTFAKRWAVSATVLHSLRSFFGAAVLETVIPEDVKASETVSAGLPLTHYAPKSRSAAAVRELAEELRPILLQPEPMGATV